jgi:hypothetical protein
MNSPKGTGIWVAFFGAADGGDIDKIVAKCQKYGIGWLNYSIPSTWLFQVQHIATCFQDGVDGHIIDAEMEWEHAHGYSDHDTQPEAKNFIDALRAHLGDSAFLAHAPIAFPTWHASYPYHEFDRLDASMPQVYWTEHDTLGAARTIATVDSQFLSLGIKQTIMPIGVTYGKGTGYGHPPGEITSDDVKYFIDHYPGPKSFYSYEASMAPFWAGLPQSQPFIQPDGLTLEKPQDLG